VHDSTGVRVFYYNTAGKKFASRREVDAFFTRLGYQVARDVFDFEVSDADRTLAGGGPLFAAPRDAVEKTTAAVRSVRGGKEENGDGKREEEDEDEEIDV